MNYAEALLSALHWLGVALYIGSFLFLLLILQPVYRKYKSYKYVDNFRAEVIQLYWKFLHVAFALIVVSGIGLAGLKGKSIIKGMYGFVFSAKLALWLLQIYLAQETLRPFVPELHSAETDKEKTPEAFSSPVLILILLLLISLCGFVLKYL